MATEKHTCVGPYGLHELTSGESGMRCGARAAYEHGGKWYCSKHDPSHKERAAKRADINAANSNVTCCAKQQARAFAALITEPSWGTRLNYLDACYKTECAAKGLINAEK